MLPDVSTDEPSTEQFGATVRDALAGNFTPDRGTRLTAGENTDISVNLGNLSLVVGADVTLDQLNAYLDDHGVTCVAVPAAGGDRSIGDLVATATGQERIEIRHALLGADVLVVDGEAKARFGAETMKDVAGYDTKRLYIGAHGAFGPITRLIFKIGVKA